MVSGSSATASHRFQAQAVEEGNPKDRSVHSVFNVLGVEASRPVGPWRCSRRLTAGAASPGARCAGASFPTRTLWHAIEGCGLVVLHVLDACPIRLPRLPAPHLPALGTLSPRLHRRLSCLPLPWRLKIRPTLKHLTPIQLAHITPALIAILLNSTISALTACISSRVISQVVQR